MNFALKCFFLILCVVASVIITRVIFFDFTSEKERNFEESFSRSVQSKDQSDLGLGLDPTNNFDEKKISPRLSRGESIENLDDFKKELEAITNEFGNGRKKYQEILKLFRKSKVSVTDLVGFLETVDDKKFLLNARVGLSLRFSGNNIESISAVANVSELKKSEIGKSILKEGMQYYVYSTAEDDVERRMFEVQNLLFSEGLNGDYLEETVLLIGGTGDTAQRVKDFVSVFESLLVEEKENRTFLSNLFKAWEGPEAIGGLEALGQSINLYDSQAVWELVGNALDYSPEKALGLLNLSNEGVKAALVENQLKLGNLNDARVAYERASFEDDEIRRKVEWHLWDVQQKSVRKAMKQDPDVTVDSLLHGTSEYDQNFLETAVTHWIAKDPEQAADWTESNIDQMDPVARQYVAASYAKEAAAQGDMTTARQWANLIEDEDTLTRINGLLEKAEQAASN